METKNNFDIANFLVLNLSKEIEGGMMIVQGTATFIPMAATSLAMKEKKIELVGGFYSNPEMSLKIPSTFCSENYSGGKAHLGLSGFLDLLQNRKVDLEFLRPAQVDKFGNINNTVIEEYNNPKVRLPGGMGIDDVMHFIKKIVLYIPNHNLRTFVEKVDFKTSSGWDKGKGPDKIITNLCVFEFPDKNITLTAINPNYSVEEVQKQTGFKFKLAKEIKKMSLVDEKQKELIESLDPLGLRDLEIKERRKEVLDKFK